MWITKKLDFDGDGDFDFEDIVAGAKSLFDKVKKFLMPMAMVRLILMKSLSGLIRHLPSLGNCPVVCFLSQGTFKAVLILT